MKTITIKQPWATLIREGYKEYEFRNWKTKYRGPLLIHAGKGVDKKGLEYFKDLHLSCPTSKIIAQVILEDCILIDDEMNNKLLKENKKVYGMKKLKDAYAWKLSNIKKIDNNEYVKGKLSLWDKDI
jgi:hypothetical protein